MEFLEVMRQARRMCVKRHCKCVACPLEVHCKMSAKALLTFYADYERAIVQWAAENS